MLSSYPIGGRNRGDRQRDDQQQGNNPQQQQRKKGQQQKQQPSDVTFLPPKFHGIVSDKPPGVIVKAPEFSFQVPFGVDVDPIFDFIRSNNPTAIAPLLKNKQHDVNTKLFDGAFVPGPIALYVGFPKAVKDFQKGVANSLISVTPAKHIESDAIRTAELPKFTTTCREIINSLIEEEFGETFDEDHKDKAKSILYVVDTLYGKIVAELVAKFKRSPKPANPGNQPPAGQQLQGTQQPAGQQRGNRGRRRGGPRQRPGGGERIVGGAEDYSNLKSLYDTEQYKGSLPKKEEPKPEVMHPTEEEPTTDLAPQNNPFTEEPNPEVAHTQFSSFGSVGGGKYNKDIQYPLLFLPLVNQYTPVQPHWYEIPATSFNNLTSLQYAAGYGSVGSVSVLIRNGADYKLTTKDGVSLRDFAQARPSEIRKSDVVKLLTAVFKAVDVAFTDVGLKTMKSNYVEESGVPSDLKQFEDTLNYVYTKEFKAGRKLTTPGAVLSKKEEDAKKKGKEDGKKNTKDDTYADSDDDAIKEAYNLGFEMGRAETQGELDGSADVPTERDEYVNHPKPEVQKAYREAFLKAKGQYILKGFEDGIRGKEFSPPGGKPSSLGFDPQFAALIQLSTVDPKIEQDYTTGYNTGIVKFADYIPTLIGTSPNSGSAIADGLIDGKAGEKYKTTFKIKTKPLLGSNQYGPDEQTFEGKYDEIDVTKDYDPSSVRNIPIPSDRKIAPNKYGAYILNLYEEGYAQAQRNKGGNKTYRRKRSGKSKTYKKKLSKK